MMAAIVIDAHMHLNDPKYSPADRKEILADMARLNISGICSGWDHASGLEAVRIAEQYPFIYATAGLHPAYADGAQIELLSGLTDLAEKGKIVAVGECGLDKCCSADWALQKKALEIQLDIADRLQLPVVLHVRKAHEEMLEILSERKGKVRCMLHGCSASWEQAQRYLKLGCMLSFGGSVTWKNAVKSVRTARNTPPDRILVETDSPYMAPEPERNMLNRPQNILSVFRKLAEIKGLTDEEMQRTVLQNAGAFFGLKDHTEIPAIPD